MTAGHSMMPATLEYGALGTPPAAVERLAFMFRRQAVVRIEPKEGVFGHTKLTQDGAETTDGAVHGRDLREAVPEFLAGDIAVKRDVRGSPRVRAVRRAEPEHDEKRPPLGRDLARKTGGLGGHQF